VSVQLRDEVETVLRAWDKYEKDRNSPPIIDYDCHPTDTDVAPAGSRLEVFRRLTELRQRAENTGETQLIQRIDADLAYRRALMGERTPVDEYVRATQGCPTAGWPEEYVTACGEVAHKRLDAIGVSWGADTETQLEEAEGPLDVEEAPEAIREAAAELEPAVRQATGTSAPYELTITTTHVDAYWSYWLDGAGQQVRLRLNLRNARFTKVRARQFALHEVLGHGLQSASWAARCAEEDVAWVRLLSVHAPHQVLLEGLAQALPLFITPDDDALITRVRLAHYLQLVYAELHVAINAGHSIEECAEHARTRVPWWTDPEIADALADRSTDPLLRTYLWAYPAGLDWFTALAEAPDTVVREVLHAAYREPLTPADLAVCWPDGPAVGGPGGTVRLRKPPVLP
jgi:hypothetical protein